MGGMHRRFIGLVLVLLLSLTVSACGGGGGSREVVCREAFWDGTVGTCLPDEWKALMREELAELGSSPEVIVAFRTEQTVSGSAPVVAVTREALSEATDPEEYSSASVEAVKSLPGFESDHTESTRIDGADVTLHIFTAQPNADEPRRRFFQVSTVAGGVGYTFTGVLPLSVLESIEEQVKLILTNATFTEPQKE